MNLKIFALATLVLVLFSCRKERLKNEDEVLIGTYRWTSTKVTYLGSTSWSTTQYPPYDGIESCEIQILKKGILKLNVNGKCIERNRIIDANIHEQNTCQCVFELELNKHDDKCFFIFNQTGDSCSISLFPFENDGNVTYKNLFTSD